MLEKKLIVCADDFGLTKGISEGIVNAYSQGIVTRTSIIANGEAFDHAVSLSKNNEGLRVGIHLTLVEEKPINEHNKIKSLTGRNGKLLINYKAFLARYVLSKIDLNEVYAEWESQIQKVLSAGININHIDSHQHLHILPRIFEKTLDLASKYKINKIRMLYHDISDIRTLKEGFLAFLSNTHKRRLLHSGLSSSDYFWGLKQGGNIGENDILKFIDNIKFGTTEMMCHPGYADDSFNRKYSHWKYDPEQELKALNSERVRGKLKNNNIKLIS